MKNAPDRHAERPKKGLPDRVLSDHSRQIRGPCTVSATWSLQRRAGRTAARAARWRRTADAAAHCWIGGPTGRLARGAGPHPGHLPALLHPRARPPPPWPRLSAGTDARSWPPHGRPTPRPGYASCHRWRSCAGCGCTTTTGMHADACAGSTDKLCLRRRYGSTPRTAPTRTTALSGTLHGPVTAPISRRRARQTCRR